MAAQNLSLFTNVEGFEQYENEYQKTQSRKRGPYKVKEFKPAVISDYQKLDTLYSRIANYLPSPFLSNSETVFTYNGLKAWYCIYTDDNYSFESQEFKGENFKSFQAEIIGTENLELNKRIELHSKLLELLHDGTDLEKAIEILQPEIKILQKPKKELDRRML